MQQNFNFGIHSLHRNLKKVPHKIVQKIDNKNGKRFFKLIFINYSSINVQIIIFNLIIL